MSTIQKVNTHRNLSEVISELCDGGQGEESIVVATATGEWIATKIYIMSKIIPALNIRHFSVQTIDHDLDGDNIWKVGITENEL